MTSGPTALVIDDEAQIRKVVRRALADSFGRVLEASTGLAGMDAAALEAPQLIVLDLGLPDVDGTEVCRQLRRSTSAAILVLSARHADDDKIALLDSGADDYVTKPFNTLELKARVHALMRRTAQRDLAAATVIRCGGIVMDLAARTVELDRVEVHLTPIEWGLMRELMTNCGRTLTHPHLFAVGWAGQSDGDAQQYLRVHIANLRRKIESNPIEPVHIITEPGVGYRFLCG